MPAGTDIWHPTQLAPGMAYKERKGCSDGIYAIAIIAPTLSDRWSVAIYKSYPPSSDNRVYEKDWGSRAKAMNDGDAKMEQWVASEKVQRGY